MYKNIKHKIYLFSLAKRKKKMQNIENSKHLCVENFTMIEISLKNSRAFEHCFMYFIIILTWKRMKKKKFQFEIQ